MAVVLSGSTNDITINGVSVATDTEVSSAVASGVAPKANTADLTAALALKQDLLVSGTSIKTIGGVTLLGGGNLSVDPTSDQVGTATAGLSAGNIGSYMYATAYNGSAYVAVSYGNTIAGSSLKPSYGTGYNGAAARSGTWRCLGTTLSTSVSTASTLWLRIA